MKLLLIATTLFAIIFAAPNEQRIVGGYYASETQFPYTVSIRIEASNFHWCGGSILNENWILTAAHCLFDLEKDELVIVTGTIDTQIGGDFYDVDKYIVHYNYKPPKFTNDIAVIKVKTPIQFNYKVKPIKLNKNFIGAGTEAVVDGWGQISQPGFGSPLLKYLKLTTISEKDCIRRLHPNPVSKLELCGISMGPGQGACMGDSGGPVVANGVQIGILSWVIPCALGKPDVFVRVSEFYDWILEQTK